MWENGEIEELYKPEADPLPEPPIVTVCCPAAVILTVPLLVGGFGLLGPPRKLHKKSLQKGKQT